MSYTRRKSVRKGAQGKGTKTFETAMTYFNEQIQAKTYDENARRKAMERHNPERIANQLVAAYHQIISDYHQVEKL